MSLHKRKTPGRTLLSRLNPHPIDHAARLTKLGFVHPIWWKGVKAAPPKDIYPLRRTKKVTLPADRLVKSTFKKIPMLRKERYEHYNPDYQPLASRFALTQLRLMREEKLSEEDAFKKCEDEIFKEELYYFAKSIRDSPGNHFRLTSDEIRSFYIHDVINEAITIKRRRDDAVEQGTDVHQTITEYFHEPEPVLEDVQAQRGFTPNPAPIHYQPFRKGGKWEKPVGTFMAHHELDVDGALALRHNGIYQENQRYLRSQVQVPAGEFIRAVQFSNEVEYIPPSAEVNNYDNDDFWHSGMNASIGGQFHMAKDTKNFFGSDEALRFKERINRENALDRQILALIHAEKASQIAAEVASQQQKASQETTV